MGYYDKTKKFVKNIVPWGVSQTTPWKSPGVPVELIPYSNTWSNRKNDPIRKAVYTEYFWLNPPFGKPRNIDYPQLKIIENSVWTEMCVAHITDSIANAQWSIIPKNNNKKVSEKKIDEVNDFLESKEWQESFKTGIRKMIPDLINYDCGILVKIYPVSSYTNNDEYKYVLKNNHDPCMEIVSRDGRSFLKSTDIYGNIDAYYQYSWIHPNARPIRFSPDEIIYIQHKPSSRSPYGRCNLEIIEDILEYLKNSSESQEKYWKNGMFIGGQIDHPDVVELDELKRYSEYYKNNYKGIKNTNKWMITGGNTKITPLSFTPHDMQWLDGQKWFAKLVMAIYQVTPSELGFTEDINRATGIQQMNIHKSRAIRPLLNLIEDYINRHIIWSDFYKDIKFQYIPQLDLDDRRKVAEINKLLIESNIGTINEARKDDGKHVFEDERFDKTMLEIQEKQQKVQQEAQAAMFEQQQIKSEKNEIPETEYGEESAMEISEEEIIDKINNYYDLVKPELLKYYTSQLMKKL